MDFEIENHPFFEPLRKWIADQVGLEPEDVHPQVVRDITEQVQLRHGPIGDFKGLVQLNPAKERIVYEITVNEGSFSITREEVDDRVEQNA